MFSLEFLQKYVHLGIGYFLSFDPVGSNLRSVTKSESTCNHVIITSLPTSRYPTSRRKLYFSKKKNLIGFALSSLLLFYANINKPAVQAAGADTS